MIDFEDLFDATAPPKPADTYRFGTVKSINPVSVHMDGDDSSVEVPASSLCFLGVGDRVWVQLHYKQRIIQGVVGSGPRALDGSENFNDFTETNTYHQARNADASTAKNYPVASAGLLTVERAVLPGEDATYIYQRYWVYNNSGYYVRTFYTSWSSWANLI